MISLRWIEKRRKHWERLAQLTERSLADLNHVELQELGILYRQVASDLSALREDSAGRSHAQQLNRLLGRAHNVVYTARRTRPGSGILHFYAQTYPQIFRRNLSCTVAAFLVFLVASVMAFLMTLQDPAFARYMLNGPMADTIERRQMWTHSVVTMQPLASSSIMTNNLSVAFAAFAMGVTAGLGTVWMMSLNGVLLGVLGAACWQAGMSQQLWSFVAPHGALELPAIFIAGGAGLLLARSWLFPGLVSRRDSLAQGGTEAVKLLLGTIPMLVIAGIIEGFFSPTDVPPAVKFLFGAMLFALLWTYLMTPWRGKQPVGETATP